ncbi:hypothetical protein DFH08DRAFT_823983 [Mycena albidolilacea]|uniref:Uncharacterized protein n=1 Tax=Mycena albidolilacea TaxID=1033008 RepID=A0AAD6Z4X8_9AGAR|nr:hypothetical protein DFH08DRAFT_823983 [Mycena albidolilacea]
MGLWGGNAVNTSAIFETIKREYPYPTAWARDTTDSKVKGYIRRYFGNILQGSLVRTQVIQPGVGEHQNNALFTAPRPVTARQLYAADERDGILTLADNLKKKTGGNSAGCCQTALKTLWTTTDTNIKQKYEEQARQQGLNVDLSRNQREFEDNIGGTLQDFCTNGALGPAEMILLASFRNSAGELVTIAVHGHSNENSAQRSLADFATAEFSRIRSLWDDFSTEMLPVLLQDREGWTAIPRNEAGVPLFPAVDFDNAGRSGLVQITDLFFRVSWDHAWPSDQVYATVPYAEIAPCPNNFYDMERFPLRLDKPLTEMTLSQLSGIIEYLISTSATSDPFVFHAKHDILAHRRAATEALHTPSPPPAPSLLPLPVPPLSPPRAPTRSHTPVPPRSPPPVLPPSPPQAPPWSPTPVSLPAPPPVPRRSPTAVTPPSPLLGPPRSPSPVHAPTAPPAKVKGKKRNAAVAALDSVEAAADDTLGRGRRLRKSPQEAREERAQKAAEVVLKATGNKSKTECFNLV